MAAAVAFYGRVPLRCQYVSGRSRLPGPQTAFPLAGPCRGDLPGGLWTARTR